MSDLRGFNSMMGNPSPAAFTRWSTERSFTPWAPTLRIGDDDEGDVEAAPLFDAEALKQEAFDAGYEEGRKAADRQFQIECAGIERLAAALEQLRPEPPAELARMLAETVDRLVRQVVGEVEVDAALLMRRIEPLAVLMTEQTSPYRLRVNPQDALLLSGQELDVELTPDPALARGSVVLETAEGWVEDGTAVGLDRLRGALDRMAATR